MKREYGAELCGAISFLGYPSAEGLILNQEFKVSPVV